MSSEHSGAVSASSSPLSDSFASGPWDVNTRIRAIGATLGVIGAVGLLFDIFYRHTFLDWAKEYDFPNRDDRGKMNEQGRLHWEGGEHIHLGPKHVKVNN